MAALEAAFLTHSRRAGSSSQLVVIRIAPGRAAAGEDRWPGPSPGRCPGSGCRSAPIDEGGPVAPSAGVLAFLSTSALGAAWPKKNGL